MSTDKTSSIPGRIEAALSFLGHCRWVETDDTSRRDLTPGEQRVCDAALEVLRHYFTGEMDFGDAPITARKNDEDGEQPSLVESPK